jgi:hypothetical protein
LTDQGLSPRPTTRSSSASSPGINDASTVAFKARTEDSERVVTGNGGELTTIAAVGTQGIAEFGSRFPIDNNGNVAFVAALDNEETAILRGDEEALTQLAITGARLVGLFEANEGSKPTQFDPISVGTSLISVGAPDDFDTPRNFRSITATVNP